jgi:hypothetical protein
MAPDQEVVGLNPGTIDWMVVSDAKYKLLQLKNNENKGSQMRHTKLKKSVSKMITLKVILLRGFHCILNLISSCFMKQQMFPGVRVINKLWPEFRNFLSRVKWP